MTDIADTSPQPSEAWDLIIRPKRNWFDLRLRELWQARDLVMLFVWRDFVSVYKQTILGPLWYLVQPLLTTDTPAHRHRHRLDLRGAVSGRNGAVVQSNGHGAGRIVTQPNRPAIPQSGHPLRLAGSSGDESVGGGRWAVCRRTGHRLEKLLAMHERGCQRHAIR